MMRFPRSISSLPQRRAGLSALLLLALAILLPTAVSAAEDPEMAQLFDRFYQLDLDTARSAAVADFKFERDGLQVELKSGRLWLAEPLGGQVTGAYFVGEGIMTARSNGLSGLNMLKATLQGKNAGVSFPGKMAGAIIRPAIGEKDFEVFQARFSEATFRFDDGFEEEVAALMADGAGDGAEAAAAEFKSRNEAIYYMPGPRLERDFIMARLAGIERFPFFAAEFKVGSEWVAFGLLQSSPQEIWIGTHPSIGAGVVQRLFTWTNFDVAEDYDSSGHWDADLLLDQKSLLDVSKVEMVIDLPTTQTMAVDAKVTFSTLADELAVVPFDLINNLGYGWWEKGGRPVTLKSVQDAAGNELPFIHKRDTVLIRMPEPILPGEETTLRFLADEQTIIQMEQPGEDIQVYNVVNTYPWFPQHGYVGGQYAIDWTIRVKTPLSAIASGRLVESKEEGGMNISRWVSEQELAFPSFIFGRFSSREDTYKSEVTGKEIAIGVHANPIGRLRGTGAMKDIGLEAKQILKLFETFFGPFPYDRLDITQMAVGVGFGQSPPGLLFLTGEAFVSSSLAAELLAGSGRGPYYHDFFAHELAHQWFGHVVLWGRDEDQWLSEAFAEYASAIYAEQIDGDREFNRKLKEWRDAAFVAERSGFPVAGGNLVSAANAQIAQDYRFKLIYSKGAYVVHMLRSMLGPDKFLESMKKFLADYRGGMATTPMLMSTLQEVTGQPWGWFFDQWFYASGSPTLDFSYEVARSEDGGYLLTGRIVQQGDDWKQMLVPVFYDLGGKTPSVQQVAVGTSDHTFKAKLPSEPKRVWLDENHSLLAQFTSSKKP